MTDHLSAKDLTRRRAFKVAASLAGLSLLHGPRALALAPTHSVKWTGIALGAVAEMTVVHPDRHQAAQIIDKAIAEIRRLEGIFSLYDKTSALSRLNADGYLKAPSPDLLQVLSTSHSMSRLSRGAFDPTVQVLWNKEGHSSNDHIGFIDYRNLKTSPSEIRFTKPGMALTLNGIAQGYITDRITSLMAEAGLANVMIDCGEIYCAGEHANGRAWRVAMAGNPDGPLACRNQAVATSSGLTLVPGEIPLRAHLFDPATRQAADRYRSLSVVASSATLADGLSTTLSILPETEWPMLMNQFTGQEISVYAVRNDGTRSHYSV